MKIIRTDTDWAIHGTKAFIELKDRTVYCITPKRGGVNAGDVERALKLKVGDDFKVEDYPSAKDMMKM